jgi:GDP-mannose 6-dehydrogenase
VITAAHTPVVRPALSIFGLGYVGCVSAACFADRGHRVIGLDPDTRKLEMVVHGRAPVVEERIDDLIADAVTAGSLTVTDDPIEAVRRTELSLVCVGTPSAADGSVSTRHLQNVCQEIGRALAEKRDRHVVVFRSTMVPGTCAGILVPILEEASGKRAGVDFGVCVNPEFLREGRSVRDFFDPPKTVVGESDPRSGELTMRLYDDLPGDRFRVPIALAEMAKYVDNGFHALKVAFANEIGALCHALGLDSRAVMAVFAADHKLNISPAYLRPGFAFGGSCLPKDLRAIVHTARSGNVDVPLLANVLPSNEAHLRRAVDLVTAIGRRRVGLLGLSFKPGTDDLRESPLVELAERLIGKGYRMKIYDANVAISRLLGANRDYISRCLPHIGELLTDDVDAVLDHAEIVIVGSADDAVFAALDHIPAGRVVVDLVGIPDADAVRRTNDYVGIVW